MILFVSPGLGKSIATQRYPEHFIDCDTLLEVKYNKSIIELCQQSDWSKIKDQILPIYLEDYAKSDIILLVGKCRLIKHCTMAYLFDNTERMRKSIASPNRANPIFNWNCIAKHSDYLDNCKKYNIPIKVCSKYFLDEFFSNTNK